MEAKLIKDKIQQASLKEKTKFLINEALTAAIEVIEGKKIEEWTAERKEEVNKHSSFPNLELDQACDGKRIIEYCDAVKLLKEYYAAGSYVREYREKIIRLQKDNEEFSPQQFRKEFDKQCESERKILEDLATTRNKEMVHNVNSANMGEIYIWIRQLMKYLEAFIGYRMQVLSRYDENYGKREDIEILEEYYTRASELKEECFASKENYKEFRFGKNTYKIAKDDKNDFPLLISDMARRWEEGIKYLKKEKTQNLFAIMLEEYVDDYDVVMRYEDIYELFRETSEKSIEESVYYMSILYTIVPELNGIYWKGVRYSESYFASRVLQVLTRHPNTFSIDGKIETLKYRIKNFTKWNEVDETHRGIGMDILLFCEQEILSSYFKGRKDMKGFQLASVFEKNILNCDTIELNKEEYDEVIKSVLSLTAHMKGCVTYMLPIPEEKNEGKMYRSFRTIEEFRAYFIKFVTNASDLQEIDIFVRKIADDRNLMWFIDNYEMYERKDISNGDC